MHVDSQQEVDSLVADLQQAGAMQHTTVVAAPKGCGLGERYAALCSALSIAERVRDQGGHSFVILDDISIMVQHSCITDATLKTLSAHEHACVNMAGTCLWPWTFASW